MVTVDEGGDVYPGLGPREEVKPYVLLDYIYELVDPLRQMA